MKVVEKQVKVYISEDGKEFMDQAQCEAHERKIQMVMNFKYFAFTAKPDLTEGKGYYKHGVIVVNRPWIEPETAEQYMYDTFGRKIAYVQGASPMTSWYISPITYEQYVKDTYDQVVFISKLSVNGFPEPIWVE